MEDSSQHIEITQDIAQKNAKALELIIQSIASPIQAKKDSVKTTSSSSDADVGITESKNYHVHFAQSLSRQLKALDDLAERKIALQETATTKPSWLSDSVTQASLSAQKTWGLVCLGVYVIWFRLFSLHSDKRNLAKGVLSAAMNLSGMSELTSHIAVFQDPESTEQI